MGENNNSITWEQDPLFIQHPLVPLLSHAFLNKSIADCIFKLFKHQELPLVVELELSPSFTQWNEIASWMRENHSKLLEINTPGSENDIKPLYQNSIDHATLFYFSLATSITIKGPLTHPPFIPDVFNLPIIWNNISIFHIHATNLLSLENIHFPNIEVLDVSSNPNLSTIPDFLQMTNLRVLNLSHTNLFTKQSRSEISTYEALLLPSTASIAPLSHDEEKIKAFLISIIYCQRLESLSIDDTNFLIRPSLLVPCLARFHVLYQLHTISLQGNPLNTILGDGLERLIFYALPQVALVNSAKRKEKGYSDEDALIAEGNYDRYINEYYDKYIAIIQENGVAPTQMLLAFFVYSSFQTQQNHLSPLYLSIVDQYFVPYVQQLANKLYTIDQDEIKYYNANTLLSDNQVVQVVLQNDEYFTTERDNRGLDERIRDFILIILEVAALSSLETVKKAFLSLFEFFLLIPNATCLPVTLGTLFPSTDSIQEGKRYLGENNALRRLILAIWKKKNLLRCIMNSYDTNRPFVDLFLRVHAEYYETLSPAYTSWFLPDTEQLIDLLKASNDINVLYLLHFLSRDFYLIAKRLVSLNFIEDCHKKLRMMIGSYQENHREINLVFSILTWMFRHSSSKEAKRQILQNKCFEVYIRNYLVNNHPIENYEGVFEHGNMILDNIQLDELLQFENNSNFIDLLLKNLQTYKSGNLQLLSHLLNGLHVYAKNIRQLKDDTRNKIKLFLQREVQWFQPYLAVMGANWRENIITVFKNYEAEDDSHIMKFYVALLSCILTLMSFAPVDIYFKALVTVVEEQKVLTNIFFLLNETSSAAYEEILFKWLDFYWDSNAAEVKNRVMKVFPLDHAVQLFKTHCTNLQENFDYLNRNDRYSSFLNCIKLLLWWTRLCTEYASSHENSKSLNVWKSTFPLGFRFCTRHAISLVRIAVPLIKALFSSANLDQHLDIQTEQRRMHIINQIIYLFSIQSTCYIFRKTNLELASVSNEAVWAQVLAYETQNYALFSAIAEFHISAGNIHRLPFSLLIEETYMGNDAACLWNILEILIEKGNLKSNSVVSYRLMNAIKRSLFLHEEKVDFEKRLNSHFTQEQLPHPEPFFPSTLDILHPIPRSSSDEITQTQAEKEYYFDSDSILRCLANTICFLKSNNKLLFEWLNTLKNQEVERSILHYYCKGEDLLKNHIFLYPSLSSLSQPQLSFQEYHANITEYINSNSIIDNAQLEIDIMKEKLTCFIPTENVNGLNSNDLVMRSFSLSSEIRQQQTTLYQKLLNDSDNQFYSNPSVIFQEITLNSLHKEYIISSYLSCLIALLTSPLYYCKDMSKEQLKSDDIENVQKLYQHFIKEMFLDEVQFRQLIELLLSCHLFNCFAHQKFLTLMQRLFTKLQEPGWIESIMDFQVLDAFSGYLLVLGKSLLPYIKHEKMSQYSEDFFSLCEAYAKCCLTWMQFIAGTVARLSENNMSHQQTHSMLLLYRAVPLATVDLLMVLYVSEGIINKEAEKSHRAITTIPIRDRCKHYGMRTLSLLMGNCPIYSNYILQQLSEISTFSSITVRQALFSDLLQAKTKEAYLPYWQNYLSTQFALPERPFDIIHYATMAYILPLESKSRENVIMERISLWMTTEHLFVAKVDIKSCDNIRQAEVAASTSILAKHHFNEVSNIICSSVDNAVVLVYGAKLIDHRKIKLLTIHSSFFAAEKVTSSIDVKPKADLEKEEREEIDLSLGEVFIFKNAFDKADFLYHFMGREKALRGALSKNDSGAGVFDFLLSSKNLEADASINGTNITKQENRRRLAESFNLHLQLPPVLFDSELTALLKNKIDIQEKKSKHISKEHEILLSTVQMDESLEKLFLYVLTGKSVSAYNVDWTVRRKMKTPNDDYPLRKIKKIYYLLKENTHVMNVVTKHPSSLHQLIAKEEKNKDGIDSVEISSNWLLRQEMWKVFQSSAVSKNTTLQKKSSIPFSPYYTFWGSRVLEPSEREKALQKLHQLLKHSHIAKEDTATMFSKLLSVGGLGLQDIDSDAVVEKKLFRLEYRFELSELARTEWSTSTIPNGKFIFSQVDINSKSVTILFLDECSRSRWRTRLNILLSQTQNAMNWRKKFLAIEPATEKKETK